jgi:hypothetical protein
MPIQYGAKVDVRGKATENILTDIYFQNKTISEGKVTFNADIKSGSIITESAIDAVLQAYTGQALSSAGSIELIDYLVVPNKFEFKHEFLEETLRSSRFNTTMSPGAWNIQSSEFDEKVLFEYGPKASSEAEKLFWGGITAATKTAIAALTPGAGQGSITAATQTKVAAMTAGLMDGVIATALYNDQFKSAGLGSFIKVAGTVLTSANIAAEYAKVYAAIPAAVLEDEVNPVVIYAPYSHRQLMRIANNAVGAAQQINFLFEDASNTSKVFYNGVEVLFVPMPEGYMYAAKKTHVSWNTDLTEDLNTVQVDKKQADSDVKFIRMVFTMKAVINKQAFNVLYGS